MHVLIQAYELSQIWSLAYCWYVVDSKSFYTAFSIDVLSKWMLFLMELNAMLAGQHFWSSIFYKSNHTLFCLTVDECFCSSVPVGFPLLMNASSFASSSYWGSPWCVVAQTLDELLPTNYANPKTRQFTMYTNVTGLLAAYTFFAHQHRQYNCILICHEYAFHTAKLKMTAHWSKIRVWVVQYCTL